MSQVRVDGMASGALSDSKNDQAKLSTSFRLDIIMRRGEVIMSRRCE